MLKWGKKVYVTVYINISSEILRTALNCIRLEIGCLIGNNFTNHVFQIRHS